MSLRCDGRHCDMRVNEDRAVARCPKNDGISKSKFVTAVTSSEAGSVTP